MGSYMMFTVLAISADEPWLNHQTVDIYLWFTKFEIIHGFHQSSIQINHVGPQLKTPFSAWRFLYNMYTSDKCQHQGQ